jgi:hypothetical protein
MRRHALASCLLLAVTYLAWDYPPNTNAIMFLIFAHLEGGSYDVTMPLWPVGPWGNGPMILEVDCRDLPLIKGGPWSMVVAALGSDGEMSGFSNELRFHWDKSKGCLDVPDDIPPPIPPPIPPRPKPPKPPPLEIIYPPIVIKPPVFPPRPPPEPEPGSLTELCAWRGCNAPPPPPKKDPGPPITDLPGWRGR